MNRDTDYSLIIVKLCCSVIAFLATFLSGVYVGPELTWKGDGEKLIHRGSHFAAGIFIGTALIEFLGDSIEIFEFLLVSNNNGSYLSALVLACLGYLMGMMVDWVLGRVVLRFCGRRYNNKAGVRLPVKDTKAGRYCSDTNLSVGASDLESQECIVDIGDLRGLTLYQVTLLADSFFLLSALSFESTARGLYIARAKTEGQAWSALLNTTSHDIVYSISIVLTVLRAVQYKFSIVTFFFTLCYALMSPGGIIGGLILFKSSSTRGNSNVTRATTNDLWILAIYVGLCCGIFIYISVKHLLEKLISDIGYRKFFRVVLGIGVVAVLKVVDMY